MKKKNLKPVIMSALCAVALGSVSVTSSFALFTDHASTSISVTSGIVEIETSIKMVKYSSSVDRTEYSFAENEKNYTNPAIGTSFVLDSNNKSVKINKMVPGDKLTLEITNVNKSNVKTKTRMVPTHTTIEDLLGNELKDLFPALKLTLTAKDTSGDPIVAPVEKWALNDACAVDDVTGQITPTTLNVVTVDVEFVDTDNGVINFMSSDNEYQDAGCLINFALEAVQANAQTNPIDEINAYLLSQTMVGKQNKTMHETMADVRKLGYDYKEIQGYVWSIADDQFVAENSVTTADRYKYFKVYNDMPDSQDFSIYAKSATWQTATIVNLQVGLDVGDANNIGQVYYIRTDAQTAHEAIIRMTSGELTVNAPLDTLNLYGTYGAINIIASADHSVYMNGSASFIQITKGRLVLGEDSEVTRVHLNTKAENVTSDGKAVTSRSHTEFDNIIVDVGAVNTLPEFKRDAVTIDPNDGTKVCTIETENDSKDLYLFNYGIYEQIKVVDTADTEAELEWITDADVESDTETVAVAIANNYVGSGEVVINENHDIVIPEGTTIEELVKEAGISDSKSKYEVYKTDDVSPFAYITDIETPITVSIIKNFNDKVTLPVSEVTLERAFYFDAFENDEVHKAMRKVLDATGITDDKEIASLTPELLAQVVDNIQTLTANEKDLVKSIFNARFYYLDWKADFAVTFDKPVAANTVVFGGQYQSYSDSWIGFGNPYNMEPTDTFRMMKSAYDNFNADVFNMSYAQICLWVVRFGCGLVNLSEDNVGTTCSVSLRLYEVDQNDKETGEVLTVVTIPHTFSSVYSAN